jgi:O-antigen ligase
MEGAHICAPFFIGLYGALMGQPMKHKGMRWAGFFCCIAFLLPNHYSPWLSFHQELGVSLALLPLLLAGCLRSTTTTPNVAIFATILSIVPIVQLVSGQLYFSGDAWINTLYLLGFAIAAHTGWNCIDQAKKANDSPLTSFIFLWCGFLIAGILSVGLALHQWLSLGIMQVFIVDMPPGGRPFANLAQPNQLATLLLVALASLLVLWEDSRVSKHTALTSATLLVFGLVMTGSRSVVLTMIWLVPSLVYLRRRCQLRLSISASIYIILVFIILSAAWSEINEFLLLSPHTLAIQDRLANPGIRSVYWLSMLDAIAQSPWIGYGWGQIGVAQTLTALDYPATHSFFDSSHNLLLDLALWNGLPIALLSIGFLGVWFINQIRQCKTPTSSAMLVAVGAVFTHAMVEYPLNYAYFLLPVGLWMGALSALHPLPRERSTATGLLGRMRYAIMGIGLGTLLMFINIATEYFPYEEDWRRLQFQERGIGEPSNIDPPPVRQLTQLHELMRVSRLPQSSGMSDHDIDAVKKISQRYAYPSSMFRYALVQALNNDPDGAQLTLRRLCKMQTESACTNAQQEWSIKANTHAPEVVFPDFPEPLGN